MIEVVGGQWVAIRSTYRIGRGLRAAAADDFCDCPKMAYLGTGGGNKKLGLATASQHRLLKQSPWEGGICFLNPLYIDAPWQKVKVQVKLKNKVEEKKKIKTM